MCAFKCETISIRASKARPERIFKGTFGNTASYMLYRALVIARIFVSQFKKKHICTWGDESFRKFLKDAPGDLNFFIGTFKGNQYLFYLNEIKQWEINECCQFLKASNKIDRLTVLLQVIIFKNPNINFSVNWNEYL